MHYYVYKLRQNVGLETWTWRQIVTSQTAHTKYKWPPYDPEPKTPPWKFSAYATASQIIRHAQCLLVTKLWLWFAQVHSVPYNISKFTLHRLVYVYITALLLRIKVRQTPITYCILWPCVTRILPIASQNHQRRIQYQGSSALNNTVFLESQIVENHNKQNFS